jgi:glycosyltransferase involved in cell wall biosynthesis
MQLSIDARLRRTPACTVIIPTYNRRALLQRTLDQLVRQRLPGDTFEVLVVDDGSSDGTEETVADFRDRLDVRYFWQPDEGFRAGAARNLGLARARAPVTLFLDCGVLAHSNCIRAHLASHDAAAAQGLPAAVVGYVLCFDDENQTSREIVAELRDADIDRYVEMAHGRFSRADVREHIYALCHDDLSLLDAPWVVFWTCNVSVRTRDLLDQGGFDEAFRTWGAEDVELGYRLHKAGIGLRLSRQALAVHHPHPFDADAKRAGALANYRYFARKHGISLTKALTGDMLADHYRRRQADQAKAIPKSVR